MDLAEFVMIGISMNLGTWGVNTLLVKTGYHKNNAKKKKMNTIQL